MPTRFWLAFLLFAAPAAAQDDPLDDSPEAGETVGVKYGADFLLAGVGARALGMGGAYVAHADDVTAGYWNVAGLGALPQAEAAYMHAERFDGAVSFDYAAVAYPLTETSTVAVSFVRSAVDDIANTLDAYDPDTGLPRPDAADFITYFSAADNALFLSYARRVSGALTVGASAKVIQRGIGDFADAWGYSLDVGAQYRAGGVALGLVVQDATQMVQTWSIDEARFAQLEGDERPVGLTETVLPVVRAGAATTTALNDDLALTLAADVDVAFDGYRANALSTGDVSYRPRGGAEVAYRDVLAFRVGVSDVTTNDDFGTQITPSAGVGVQLGSFGVDYAFGDFGGLTGELGQSHRVSVAYRFGRARGE